MGDINLCHITKLENILGMKLSLDLQICLGYNDLQKG
jgi:hypothetical protein